MKSVIYYREGYKIIINDKFYEVLNGKTVTHFGKLRHKPTLQEVWNKTIGLKPEELNVQRQGTKAYNKMVYTANGGM